MSYSGSTLMLINKHRDTVLQLTFALKTQWFSVWPCRCKCPINVRQLSRRRCGKCTNNSIYSRINIVIMIYDALGLKHRNTIYFPLFSIQDPIIRQVSVSIIYDVDILVAVKSLFNFLFLTFFLKLGFNGTEAFSDTQLCILRASKL